MTKTETIPFKKGQKVAAYNNGKRMEGTIRTIILDGNIEIYSARKAVSIWVHPKQLRRLKPRSKTNGTVWVNYYQCEGSAWSVHFDSLRMAKDHATFQHGKGVKFLTRKKFIEVQPNSTIVS